MNNEAKPKELVVKAETERYFLEARAKFFKNDGVFFIKATDKLTLRYSFVTNVHDLLSEITADEFDLDPDNAVFQDSSRQGTIGQVQKWFNRAKSLLKDKKYLPYLERTLDDDRLAGEWENKLQ